MIALVTGGGGFLGGAIVRLLRARGDTVRSISRGDYPALRALGVETIQADLADRNAVVREFESCDVVFHVAAKAGIWGARSDFERANVAGTQSVLDACRASGVRRLVFTSSPSVVFGGGDMEGVDESVPYPAHYEADYPATKARAEQFVRAANGPSLATVALRPHLIWGPGDPHLVPRILAKGRAGRLRRIGKKNPLVDSIYIDNAAHAHVQAADRLFPGSALAGKVYFLSHGEPWPVWDLVNAILKAGRIPPVTRTVPRLVALAAGGFLESAYRLLRLPGEPPMTRFLAQELSTAHWFNIEAARRDFDYTPHVSMVEGLRRLEAALNP